MLIKTFAELTNEELYQLLKLRQDVFVLEQACLYPDIDGLDKHSLHFLHVDDGQLVAYCRLLEVPEQVEFIRLGRIIVSDLARGQGLGKQLIEFIIEYVKSSTDKKIIVISAQTRLLTFYQECGFEVVSAPYDEDGIEHINMHLLL